MSGSNLARAYRRTLSTAAPSAGRWRNYVLAAGAAISLLGFGSIIVKAGDDSGVYDIARQYSNARGAPRFQLPRIFQPSARAVPATASSYAPVYPYAAPATGKRSVDRPRREAHAALRSSPKSIKVSLSHPRGRDGASDLSISIANRTSYCVRSCDGYFFPIGTPESGDLSAHESACSRACPGAETSVFVAASGSAGIDDAVNRRGQRYQATQTAFNHRTQVDSACTCTGAPGRARNYSILNDFTLRPGDLVMSREGLKVFRDTEVFPYRAQNFTKASGVKLSASERRWLDSSEAASMRGMQGAKTSPSLKARIEQQINNVRGRPTAQEIGLRGIERSVSVSDGRQLRYVGPDSATVQR